MVETASLPELKLRPEFRADAEVKFMNTLAQPKKVSWDFKQVSKWFHEFCCPVKISSRHFIYQMNASASFLNFESVSGERCEIREDSACKIKGENYGMACW